MNVVRDARECVADDIADSRGDDDEPHREPDIKGQNGVRGLNHVNVLDEIYQGLRPHECDERGPDDVEAVLRRLEQRIASGFPIKGMPWRTFLAVIRSIESDREVTKKADIKRNAIVMLFEEGHPFRIGKYRIVRVGEDWFVDGRPWRGDPKGVPAWLNRIAAEALWRITPLGEEARAHLKGFPVFREAAT